MKIVSYNVNGVRAAIRKGWFEWVAANDFDVIGLQEVKADAEQVDMEPLRALGFEHQYWFSADKKGYSGVAIFSKIRPDYVATGIGHPFFDGEGRVIRADFGDFTLLNCYFPSGTSGDVRQNAKYEFLDAFFPWAMRLKEERPRLMVQGDYNIAHQNIDLHNPRGNQKTSGFLPEERAWMSKWLTEGGFVDSFRHVHPDLQKYSWWNMRTAARSKNQGWRIDYQAVTENLRGNIRNADLLNDAVHSDHCPCWIDLDV